MFTSHTVPKHFKTEKQKRRESESRWRIAGRFLFYVGVTPVLLGLGIALIVVIGKAIGLV